jgi:RNA polymerase-binding transcription factor DksA
MKTIARLTTSERREIEATLLSEIERSERRVLTEALRRLEEGTYGQCVYCSNPIPTERLLVLPETDHCLGCGDAA